jgi:hypothetical protein
MFVRTIPQDLHAPYVVTSMPKSARTKDISCAYSVARSKHRQYGIA